MKKAVLAGILTAAMLASPLSAVAKQPSNGKVAAATHSKKDVNKILKLSEDGFAGLHAVRRARLAIFNGDTKSAQSMVNDAIKSFKKAKVDAKSFVGRRGKAGKHNAQPGEWIPVNGSIVLGEDFQMTKQKKQYIAKANEHLKKGDRKKAIEALKLADIDVGYTRALVPLKSATKRLAKTNALLKDGKYYEANLVLKSIEDSIVVDTVMLIDVPTKKASAKTAPKAAAKPATTPAKKAPAATTTK